MPKAPSYFFPESALQHLESVVIPSLDTVQKTSNAVLSLCRTGQLGSVAQNTLTTALRYQGNCIGPRTPQARGSFPTLVRTFNTVADQRWQELCSEPTVWAAEEMVCAFVGTTDSSASVRGFSRGRNSVLMVLSQPSVIGSTYYFLADLSEVQIVGHVQARLEGVYGNNIKNGTMWCLLHARPALPAYHALFKLVYLDIMYCRTQDPKRRQELQKGLAERLEAFARAAHSPQLTMSGQYLVLPLSQAAREQVCRLAGLTKQEKNQALQSWLAQSQFSEEKGNGVSSIVPPCTAWAMFECTLGKSAAPWRCVQTETFSTDRASKLVRQWKVNHGAGFLTPQDMRHWLPFVENLQRQSDTTDQQWHTIATQAQELHHLLGLDK